jgi:hypothetical protein
MSKSIAQSCTSKGVIFNQNQAHILHFSMMSARGDSVYKIWKIGSFWVVLPNPK